MSEMRPVLDCHSRDVTILKKLFDSLQTVEDTGRRASGDVDFLSGDIQPVLFFSEMLVNGKDYITAIVDSNWNFNTEYSIHVCCKDLSRLQE